MKTKITLKTPGLLKLAIISLAILFQPGMLNAQLTGAKNIPGDYATLAAAITDLNAQDVGGVTLSLFAGNTDTAHCNAIKSDTDTNGVKVKVEFARYLPTNNY
jgi:hypothetical protein